MPKNKIVPIRGEEIKLKPVSETRLKTLGASQARPSDVPRPEGQRLKATVAKARTVTKRSLAQEARRQPGTTSTDRLKARINLQKTQKGLDKLGRLSKVAKKSRSPAGLAFAIGLDAVIASKRPGLQIKGAPTGTRADKIF